LNQPENSKKFIRSPADIFRPANAGEVKTNKTKKHTNKQTNKQNTKNSTKQLQNPKLKKAPKCENKVSSRKYFIFYLPWTFSI